MKIFPRKPGSFNKSVLQLSAIMIGLILLLFYKLFLGYRPSNANLTYSMPPWNEIYEVRIAGPLISDPADAAYPMFFEINKDLREGKIDFWESSTSLGYNITSVVISR